MSTTQNQIVSATVLLLAMSYTAVNAQSLAPSALTPTYLAPQTGDQRSLAAVLPPKGPPLAESALSSMNVLVGQIQVDGGFAAQASATESILSRYLGRRIDAKKIYELAMAVEQMYTAAGFMLVRVVVPAQALVDGARLHLSVIDGYVENIDVRELPETVRAIVQIRLQPLVNRRGLTTSEIERCLLLAGELPGVRLTSTLVPGSSLGSARLIVAGTFEAFHGTLQIDNHLSRLEGPWQSAVTVAGNSLMGFGDQVYVYVSGSRPTNFSEIGRTLAIEGAGASLPYGFDGSVINTEVTTSSTHTAARQQVPASAGLFKRASVHWATPLVLTRSEREELSLGAETINQQLTLPDFSTVLQIDDYQAARVKISQDIAFNGGQTLTWSLGASRGIGGRGESSAARSGVALSNSGASPHFMTLNGKFENLISNNMIQVRSNATSQWSFGHPVFTSEQFSLAGADSVSSFSSGDLQVDSGVTARLAIEIASPVSFMQRRFLTTPYLFMAGGLGRDEQPAIGLAGPIRASSWGAGARASWSDAVQCVAEISRGASNSKGAESGLRTRITLTGRF